MDRVFAKWITYAAIGLVIVYVYLNIDSIGGAVRGFVGNWWR